MPMPASKSLNRYPARLPTYLPLRQSVIPTRRSPTSLPETPQITTAKLLDDRLSRRFSAGDQQRQSLQLNSAAQYVVEVDLIQGTQDNIDETSLLISLSQQGKQIRRTVPTHGRSII